VRHPSARRPFALILRSCCKLHFTISICCYAHMLNASVIVEDLSRQCLSNLPNIGIRLAPFGLPERNRFDHTCEFRRPAAPSPPSLLLYQKADHL